MTNNKFRTFDYAYVIGSFPRIKTENSGEQMLEFSTKLGQNFKKYIYICNNFTDFFPKTGGASAFPSFYGCYDIGKHFPVKSKLK